MICPFCRLRLAEPLEDPVKCVACGAEFSATLVARVTQERAGTIYVKSIIPISTADLALACGREFKEIVGTFRKYAY